MIEDLIRPFIYNEINENFLSELKSSAGEIGRMLYRKTNKPSIIMRDIESSNTLMLMIDDSLLLMDFYSDLILKYGISEWF